MDITDVRVRLVTGEQARLKAFCSITLANEFVVQDLKVIDGPKGYFVAMPSRKLSERCPRCGTKNHLRANYCNECGQKLRPPQDSTASANEAFYTDIAHPIDPRCREQIQQIVLKAYEEEMTRASDKRGSSGSHQPGDGGRSEDQLPPEE